MNFTERMKDLIKKGASMEEIASSFGLDVNALPPEWMMFISNSIMFTCSMMAQLESVNSKMEGMTLEMVGMNDKVEALTSAIGSLQDSLREKNNKNSSNSSLPPSRDGYSKPNRNTSLREKSGRKPGAQEGHKGKGLKKVMADETQEHDHYPMECMKCENFASCVSLMKAVSTGHVYETRTIVTDNEHKAYSIVCPKIRKLLCGENPKGVKSSQQYGNSIKEYVVSLWSIGVTSLNRLKKLVSKHLGLDVSEGTISNMLIDFASKCGKAVEKVKDFLKGSKTKGADETGIRTEGSLHWLHVVCNNKATYLYADKKRGFDAVSGENGILLDSFGTLIHDCFSPYFKLNNIEHAICLQHIQRELRAAAIREKKEEEYFKDLESFLLEMRKAKMDAIEEGKTSLDKETIEMLKKRFRLKIENGLSKFKKPKRCRLKLGKIPEGKTRSLLLRLQANENAVFKFLEDFEVEYTNNESERSLRPSKVRQSVSKCFRKLEGLKRFASIQTVLDTANKNKIDHSTIIRAVLDGSADSLLASVLG